MLRLAISIGFALPMLSACTGSVEWEIQRIDYKPACDLERVISFDPEDRMNRYIEEARITAEEDHHSDLWRCQLFEAAHHARSIPSHARWDGAVLGINLERAALALQWIDARPQIDRAFALASRD